jgi:hypothetical protein
MVSPSPSPLVLALVFLLAAGGARAEIYEWRDQAGSRHFTNNRDAVPPEHREGARVVVVEPAAPAMTVEPPAPAAPAEEPRREAQVVYDEEGLRRAYAAGLRDGLALAEQAPAGGAAGIQINGPLAVADARAVDRDYGFALPYAPFVTTSFDRGRSRHLTLRMLLQDQFQLDRDGPFLHERLPTGNGPSFRVFLPRGLRDRLPPGNRVLFR